MMIEHLEERRLLAVTLGPGGVLTLQTSSTNTAVGATFQVTQSGSTLSVSIDLSGDDQGIDLSVNPVNLILINGTPGNDNILVDSSVIIPVQAAGNVGDDTIQALGSGDGNLLGGPGQDSIVGGTGHDLIYGDAAAFGAGGAGGTDYIDGNSGNDTIYGGVGGGGVVFGNAGDDTILGSAGNDFLWGGYPTGTNDGPGDSIAGGDGNDTLVGGLGADSLDGGDSILPDPFIDVLSYQDRTTTGTRGVNVSFDSVINDGDPTQGDADSIVDSTFEAVFGGAANDTLDNSQSPDAKLMLGFAGADSITGTQFGTIGDTIEGGAGDDTLRGLASPDVIFGGLGNDLCSGGADGDTIFGGAGPDTIGGVGVIVVEVVVPVPDGNDTLQGDDGDDSIDGGVGDDLYQGGPGDDILFAGFDTYALDDTLSVGSGADTFQGAGGNDTVDYSQRTSTFGLRITFNGAADDGAPGKFAGEGDNVTSSIETLIGGSRNDLISGASSGFPLMLNGASGNDTIIGGIDADTLVGGSGNDTLDGNVGGDSIAGGSGIDTVTYATRPGAVTISQNDLPDDGATNEQDNVSGMEILVGGSGNDTITGGVGNESLVGNAGNDSLTGGDGDDTLDGGTGGDVMDGGNGFDLVDYSSRSTGVTITYDGVANDGAPGEGDNVLGTVEYVSGTGGNDTLTGGAGFHTLNGGDGDDCLIGSSTNDVLYGGRGNDTLLGNGGRDYLNGGVGNDSLDGGADEDTLLGSQGSDVLRGGTGKDLVSFRDHATAVNASLDGKPNDGSKAENDFILGDVENLQGGSGRDKLTGNTKSNRIYGGAGNDAIGGGGGQDTLFGDAGSDTLNGGSGNDVLDGGADGDRFIGGTGNDTADYSTRNTALFLSLDNRANDGAVRERDKLDSDIEIILAGSGNDNLFGGPINVTINGGAGNDTITGGVGNDLLIGGFGLDVFFSKDGKVDTLDGGDGADNATTDIGMDILTSIETTH